MSEEKPMSIGDIKVSIENIDSMIREYDYHGCYDMFSQQEINKLRKTKKCLQLKYEQLVSA